MNHNKSVVTFTIVTTLFLFGASIANIYYNIPIPSFDNISIVNDIIKPSSNKLNQTASFDSSVVAIDSLNSLNTTQTNTAASRAIQMYETPNLITSFATDSTLCALPGIMQKLMDLKERKKGKVRIAWLGDSMIEGDLLTQTFRRKIQLFFGGQGVGFIAANSVTAGFRTTATQKWEGTWQDETFKNKTFTAPLFLSGHLFYTENGSISLKDNTVKDTNQVLIKSLICGKSQGLFNVTINGIQKQFSSPKTVNKIVLDSSITHSIQVAIADKTLPVYGISMEPTNGVVVDNFSFRGITGLELAKLDTSFLQALQQENKYDLIILEYGANLLFRPNDMDYTWYQSHITPVVKRLKHAMPGAEFLIVSTSDRAFKYGESWHSANGIHNLIKAQADLAYTNGTAFYNMFSSMGGDGTIVKWADSTTPIANKDYIHPNHKGAEILGTMFYNDFMKEYSKQVLHSTHKSDFVNTNSGTIIDKKNNLEWCIASDKDYSWNEAHQWIKNLNADTGLWHLPTSEQLLLLFDKKESAGYGYTWQGKIFTAKIDTAFGKIGHSCWVWTNEMLGSEKAYSVNFSEGIKVVSLKNTKDYPIRVFAVRKLRSS